MMNTCFGFHPRGSGSGGGSVTGANMGLSLGGSNVQLGQSYGQSGNPAVLSENREIPLAGFITAWRSGTVLIGDDHFTGTDTRFCVNRTDSLGSGVIHSNVLTSFCDKLMITDNNANLSFWKESNITTGYLSPDATTTLLANDYQHNTFATTFGGGFLSKTGVPVQTISAGNSMLNAVSVNFRKFLIQGGDTKNITGFMVNTKYLMEVSSVGTLDNYADIVVGGTVRLGTGSGYVITNKYGHYILPVQDGSNVTNGYSIYSEGTTDKAFFGGSLGIGRIPNSVFGVPMALCITGYSSVGSGTHFNDLFFRFVINETETVAGTSNPFFVGGLMIDRTLTLANNISKSGTGNTVLSTGYFSCDANTTFNTDYQNTILGYYSSGGFLSKAGVATQTITAGNTPGSGISVNGVKFLLQDSDTKNITAFVAGVRYILEIRSAGTLTNYADVVLGVTSRTGAGTLTITTRYGLYILPIKDGLTVTTGYGIYQEGASDINYFGGSIGIGQTAPAARLHIAAGTATASTAPMKLTTGVNLGTAEVGAVEFSSNVLYFTPAGTDRRPVSLGGLNEQSGTSYNVQASDQGKMIGLTNTAARAIALVAANAIPAGIIIWFKDEAGTAGAGNITITRAGSDTIDGANTAVINTNFGFVGLYSDGVSKWYSI